MIPTILPLTVLLCSCLLFPNVLSFHLRSWTRFRGKAFGAKTIWGQSIIRCKPIDTKSPKSFKFLGSFEFDLPKSHLPEIVFLGRSNVGKSSLLNSLSGKSKNIATVSKTPGRTRMINLFECSDNSRPKCIFADLPGYGFAKLGRSQQELAGEFIKKYLSKRESIRLAILLVDSRRGLDDSLVSDKQMFEVIWFCISIQLLLIFAVSDQFLIGIDTSVIIVATKIDALIPVDRPKALASIQHIFSIRSDEIIPYSSRTDEGKKELWNAINIGLTAREEEPHSTSPAEVGELYDNFSLE
jgi:GTP-binding protein